MKKTITNIMHDDYALYIFKTLQIRKEYYKQLYASKFENFYKIEKFL